MKHEAEIMNIRSRNYVQKFKSIDSEVQDNIIIASLENHQKKSYLLKTWDEECTLGGKVLQHPNYNGVQMFWNFTTLKVITHSVIKYARQ